MTNPVTLIQGINKGGSTTFTSGLILLPGGYTNTPVLNKKTMTYTINHYNGSFIIRSNGVRCSYTGIQHNSKGKSFLTEAEAIEHIHKIWPARVKKYLLEFQLLYYTLVRANDTEYICRTTKESSCINCGDGACQVRGANPGNGCAFCEQSCGLKELKLTLDKYDIDLKYIN